MDQQKVTDRGGGVNVLKIRTSLVKQTAAKKDPMSIPDKLFLDRHSLHKDKHSCGNSCGKKHNK